MAEPTRPAASPEVGQDPAANWAAYTANRAADSVRSTGGKSRALERYQVAIEDPKDPQVPIQGANVVEPLASVQPAGTAAVPGAGSG